MSKPIDNPYAELERVFHEPNRLAIVSHLAGSAEGVPFTVLRDDLGLTDGNLSQHLKTLAAACVVGIDKAFVNARPRTTVSLSERGRTQFLRYLDALEQVLQEAAAAAKQTVRKKRPRGARALPHPA